MKREVIMEKNGGYKTATTDVVPTLENIIKLKFTF